MKRSFDFVRFSPRGTLVSGTQFSLIFIHERALRIAYKDYENDFGSLLEQSISVPIHVRNLQSLMTEIYKTKCCQNPPFKEIFMQRNISYSLRGVHYSFAIMRIWPKFECG